MTPISLRLENFLSYRNQTLDFTDVSLASITGPNGNGKSAIVEAMTWALWGEARKGSGMQKPDDDLLNRSAEAEDGATEMSVDFSFRIGDTSYNVTRTYRKTASGKTTSSNLTLKNTSTGADLTAGKQRDTQALIDSAVGMTYELFSSTCLFMQGSWNQFLSATAAERKEILFDLLQMGEYQKIEQKAKRRRRELRKEKTRLEGRLSYLEDEIEAAEEKRGDIEAAKERAQSAEQTLSKLQAAREKEWEIKKEMTALENKIETRKADIQRSEKRLRTLKEDIKAYAEDIEASQQALVNLPDAAVLKEKAQSAPSEADIGSVKEQISAKQDAKHAVAKAESKLEAAKDRQQWLLTKKLPGKIEEQKKRLLPDDVVEKCRENMRRLSSDAFQEKLQAAEENEAKIKEKEAKANELEPRIYGAQSELEHAQGVIENLQDADTDECPYCGQTLTDQKREELRIEQRAAIEEIKKRIETLQSQRDSLVEEVKTLRQRVEDTYAEKERCKEAVEMLTADQEEEDALENLRDEKVRVERGDLTGYGYDKTIQEMQSAVESRKTALDEFGTPEDTLNALQEKKDAALEAKALLNDIKHHQNRIEEYQQRIDNAEKRKEDVEDQLEESRDAWNELSRQWDREEHKLFDVKVQEKDLNRAKAKVERAKDYLKELERAEADYAELQDKKSKAYATYAEEKEKERAADLLCQAFGKDGVPTMVLQGAIPSIEERTNTLLSRLTSDTYQVELRTSREKKTGGLADTFDVAVLSRSGERSYESLSGGEKARVSFAIRVALSQHLAAKTGTPIETLVIDEGFGSQDQDGLAAIQESIAKVSDSFEKVFVITHIPYFKDAFPSQIKVQKMPNGSQATIL